MHTFPLIEQPKERSRNMGEKYTSTQRPKKDKNSSGDEIANVNVYAMRTEATRIR